MAWLGRKRHHATSSLAESSLRQPFFRGGECLVKMEGGCLSSGAFEWRDWRMPSISKQSCSERIDAIKLGEPILPREWYFLKISLHANKGGSF